MNANSNTNSNELIDALRRLIEIAHGNTGQCQYVSNFLLAWWNAGSCGGFDFTDMWAVDDKIAMDMLKVVLLIAKRNNYPDAYGFRADFEQLVAKWRPHLLRGE